MHPPRASQLEWVQRNRQPRIRTAAVGTAVKDLLNAGFESDTRHRGEVLRAITEVADDAFRGACSLGRTDRKSVTILVEHPALLYSLRLEWCFLLVEHLDRRCRFGVTPKVYFRLGSSPDRFGKHEQLAD